MDPNFHCLNSKKFIQISGNNRKRVHASGRQSPRALFANLKLKKSFQEEDTTITRNLNNSKNGFGWKPPLKVDFKDSNNPCSTFYDSHRDSFNMNSQNEAASSSVQPFDIEGTNYSTPDENLNLKEHGILNDNESDEESFTGDLEKTTQYEGYFNQKNILNVQNIQEDLASHNVSFDNSMNDDSSDNSDKKLGTCTSKINYGQVNENGMSPPSLKKQEDMDINDDCSISNLEENVFNSINSQSQDTKFQCQETFQEDTDIKGYLQYRENHEYSENSNGSKSTIELNEDSKKFVAEQSNAVNINGLPFEINHENFQVAINEKKKGSDEGEISKNEIDDSFISVLTNSQVLQLESQVGKSQRNLEMTTSCIEMQNNIDMIKRFTSSLTTQNEWQRNILKSIIRDVNELNKAVVNAAASIKSLRRSDASGK